MDFTEATDRLRRCHSLEDVGEAMGVSYALARQARLAEGHPNRRNPPDGWESAIAKLARARAAELVELAEELEAS
ncbi:hypothetical protein V3331_01895 [Gaopeijia maritima]|uniref:hypothetical protein n=1 Tax=Gaopeijia maritima TaxID=3119007 RepID=UPI0032506FB2